MSNDIFGAFKDLLKESAKVLEQNTSLDFGLTNKTSNSSVVSQNNNIVVSELEASDTYTDVRILGRKARFKQANSTLFKLDTDTGSFEVDAALIPIKAKGNLWEKGSQSHVSFSNGGGISDDEIRSRHKMWYKIDGIMFENINNSSFTKHYKYEDRKLYCEGFCMYYEVNFDGVIRQQPYEIYLILYKDEYPIEELNKLVSEFNLVIDTFELLEVYD